MRYIKLVVPWLCIKILYWIYVRLPRGSDTATQRHSNTNDILWQTHLAKFVTQSYMQFRLSPDWGVCAPGVSASAFCIHNSHSLHCTEDEFEFPETLKEPGYHHHFCINKLLEGIQITISNSTSIYCVIFYCETMATRHGGSNSKHVNCKLSFNTMTKRELHCVCSDATIRLLLILPRHRSPSGGGVAAERPHRPILSLPAWVGVCQCNCYNLANGIITYIIISVFEVPLHFRNELEKLIIVLLRDELFFHQTRAPSS